MMRPQALIWGVLAGLLAGCATGSATHPASWFTRFRALQIPAGADVIQMEVVLLERPIGDSYINQEVWQLADEQVVPLEHKAILEENGFRVGQIGGVTPPGLQNLLTSERSNINPRRHYVRAGNPRLLALGPIAPLCQFQVQVEGQPAALALEQAACSLSVLPSLADRGQLRLQFTPEIEYGQKKFEAQPNEEKSGFILTPKRPTRSFADLGWEVTLAPNQYLIIGARADRFDTLGCQAFVRRDEAIPVQRLLVIRASPAVPGATNDLSALSDDDEPTPARTTPLALQAGWTTARGTSR